MWAHCLLLFGSILQPGNSKASSRRRPHFPLVVSSAQRTCIDISCPVSLPSVTSIFSLYLRTTVVHFFLDLCFEVEAHRVAEAPSPIRPSHSTGWPLPTHILWLLPSFPLKHRTDLTGAAIHLRWCRFHRMQFDCFSVSCAFTFLLSIGNLVR